MAWLTKTYANTLVETLNGIEKMENEPLVSCLCVTHNKAHLLKRAIQCFQAQTYATKELVIIYETGDEATKALVGSIQDAAIRSLEVSIQPKQTLGQLRNLSIDHCSGDYFCQWDDDDWYHPQRLEVQLQAILRSGKPASALTHWLMFDASTGNSFCSHHRIWEGSIMCKTSIARTSVRYPDYSRGEDNLFIHDLYGQYGIYHLPVPILYIYTYNGKNTWDYDHFSGLFEKGRKLTAYASSLIREVLESDVVGQDVLTELESQLFAIDAGRADPVSYPEPAVC